MVSGQADQPFVLADLLIQVVEELAENPVDMDQVRELLLAEGTEGVPDAVGGRE